MRCHSMLIPSLAIITAFSLAMVDRPSREDTFTTDFGLEDDILLPSGANPYFTLRPGAFLRLEGEDDGEPIEVHITVLDQVRLVHLQVNDRWMKVTTRVVEEREWVNDELSQVSWNYFAGCPTSGNIYYFGEDVSHYKNGEIISHEDSWLAGRDGAQPGLFLPGFFLLGSRYHQELAPNVSMDRAENIQMGVTIETPAGVFKDCVMVLETTPLEPDEEVLKVYAPGVGLIVDGDIELVEFHPGD